MAHLRDLADAELVATTLQQPKAYAHLVERHSPALSRYVGRILGREAQALEDVLQEIFIKAYRNLNEFDCTRPFPPWLFRIGHNVAIDYLRQRNAEPILVGGEDGELLLSRIAGDMGATPVPGLREQLSSAFANLSLKYRDVLILRFLEDCDYDEISDILALPPGTVAIRIKRGLVQLREHLKDWMP